MHTCEGGYRKICKWLDRLLRSLATTRNHSSQNDKHLHTVLLKHFFCEITTSKNERLADIHYGSKDQEQKPFSN